MTDRRTRPSASRRRRLRNTLSLLLVVSTAPSMVGCHVWDRIGPGPHDTTMSYHHDVGMQIEYPEVGECATPVTMAADSTSEPYALTDPASLPAMELTLEQAVGMAMQNSPVIRSLNASVTTPATSATVFDPGRVASSQQGTEAALAAFDAQFSQTLGWNKTDTPNNISQAGLGAVFTPTALQATGASYVAELQKRSATGSTFTLRHVVNYDHNNRPFRQFQSDFVGWVEAEWRQPLLRGSGLQYNRIVGANQFGSVTPGQYNGVLIARIGEDIALADFENAVVGLVADVEQAYWELTTAYRLLEANIKGRESALRTFQYQTVRLEVGAGTQDEEAQAQSQYYQFEAQVQSQLGGVEGLYAKEQKLRYLLGMPATDGKLIKPMTEPTDSKVVFDWNSALSQALDRRVEIRRQRFQVKQRELELYASRLNKRPQLDFVGQYRYRGLGDHLIGDTDDGPLDGLYSSITDGDYQEWSAGVEFTMPVGLRQAAVAISNAKLNLQRDRAVLAETELAISHELSNAARNIELTHQLVETNFNRYRADLLQVEVLERRYRDGTDNINFLLQAQRGVVTSEIEFYGALANYNLAIRDLHRRKGSLLAYNQVQLAESAWESGASRDAYEKGLHLAPRNADAEVQIPSPITRRSFNPSEVQPTLGAVTSDAVQTSEFPTAELQIESTKESTGETTPAEVAIAPLGDEGML